MTAEEYVNIDHKIQLYEEPTDETIIQTVLIEEGIQNEITESGDDDDDEIPIISHKKGKEAFNTFKQYFEQLDSATAEDILLLNKLMKKAEKEHYSKSEQSSLDLFFR